MTHRIQHLLARLVTSTGATHLLPYQARVDAAGR